MRSSQRNNQIHVNGSIGRNKLEVVHSNDNANSNDSGVAIRRS